MKILLDIDNIQSVWGINGNAGAYVFPSNSEVHCRDENGTYFQVEVTEHPDIILRTINEIQHYAS